MDSHHLWIVCLPCRFKKQPTRRRFPCQCSPENHLSKVSLIHIYIYTVHINYLYINLRTIQFIEFYSLYQHQIIDFSHLRIPPPFSIEEVTTPVQAKPSAASQAFWLPTRISVLGEIVEIQGSFGSKRIETIHGFLYGCFVKVE